MSTKVIAGFGDIAHAYDALIVDLWGVTHNGRTLYPDAVAAFDMAKAAGKQIIFLSNAPRRANNVFGQLDTYGLDRALYDDVVTSGEAAWDWIRSQAGKEALGGRCYHLGAGEKDANMRVGLDVEFVDDVTTATFILNTGPEDAVTTLAGFQPLLVQAQAASVPMVCANPDLSVFRGAVEELCAGAIAEAYEAMGGVVHWFGKPWQEVYDRCLDKLAGIEPGRVLCIGDSMRTDISGANRAKLHSLLVATGLRGTDLLTADGQSIDVDGLNRLTKEYAVAPTFACVALKP